MEIEETVPAAEIIAVPPAATSGWSPCPALDPTETITPPVGTFALFTSYETELAVPVNLTEVIPDCSTKV